MDISGSNVAQEYLHNKVHQGQMLFVSHVFEGVLNNGSVYIRHKSGLTKEIHSVVTADTTGKWEFRSYAGTTYTADGTLLEILNRKSPNGYTPEVEFRHTPTVDAIGTVRLETQFGSGTNPAKATTGSFSERLESVFGPTVDVLLEYKNASGSTQDIAIVFNFYEELPE